MSTESPPLSIGSLYIRNPRYFPSSRDVWILTERREEWITLIDPKGTKMVIHLANLLIYYTPIKEQNHEYTKT